MKAKVIFNGEEMEVILKEDQIKEHVFESIKPWKPKTGEIYYFISDDCAIIKSIEWEYRGFHNTAYEIGNCYKTIEEAVFERDCQFYKTSYKRHLEKHNDPINWEDRTQAKWYAYYDYASNKIDFNHTFVCKQQGTLYATSPECIKSYIEEYGEENFKIYILRVGG